MKDIVGFEGLYAITEDGRVWSYPKTWRAGVSGEGKNGHEGKWLRTGVHTGGYLTVGLKNSGKQKQKFIHRLVAEAFVENPCRLLEVNHKDANKRNNLYTNLEWVSRQQNAEHAKLLGLYKHEPARGERHPDAKLTEMDVISIRARHKSGVMQADLCREYHLSKSAMSSVCRGKTWSHLPS